MKRNMLFIAVLAILLMSMVIFSACDSEEEAEPYPSKPITIIVPYAAGGPSDLVFRAFASAAEEYVGQPVVVKIEEGAGGTIGTAAAAEARADGYTLLGTVMGPLTIIPHREDLPYDPIEDFTYIGQFNETPIIITVRDDAPWDNIEEFVDYARENPGLDYGTPVIGGQPHLVALGLEKLAGINMSVIAFGSLEPAATDLMGGHIDMVTMTGAFALRMQEQGTGKNLGVSLEERWEQAPDIPTLKEQGYDIVGTVWQALLMPSGAPDEVVAFWDEKYPQILEDPSFLAMMSRLEENINYLPREEMTRKAMYDFENNYDLLKEAGIID